MNTVGHLGSGNSAHESPIANSRDELKTQFITREGIYRQMTLSEYSRPNRISYNQANANVGSAPVRVSFLSVLPTTSSNHDNGESAILVNGDIPQMRPVRDGAERKGLISYNSLTHSEVDQSTANDLICFNIGRELYVYVYRGINKAVDLNKPIDKRVYKGTFPTCHDFNRETATSSSCSLIVGFSAGQIQLIDPFQKDFQVSRLFNEDRFIDKTPVTCLKWVPGQSQCFLASHTSGNLYYYNEELPCIPGPPLFQVYKQGEGYAVYTCKSKTPRNPVYRFTIGTGSIAQFAFCSQSDSKFLATVGHDGYLRIFNFQTMELTGFMKSYFGGLTCLSWSPDSRYIVTGGEDDLITVYSVYEKRIVCRGQGHKSWVSQVAFDPYTSHADSQHHHFPIDLGSDDDLRPSSLDSSSLLQKGSTVCANVGNRCSWSNANQFNGPSSFGNLHSYVAVSQSTKDCDMTPNLRTAGAGPIFSRTQKESISSTSLGGSFLPGPRASYRIGSVGQDTLLCLWDLTEDILRQPSASQRHRNSTIISVGTDQVVSQNSCSGDGTKGDGKETFKEKKLHKRGFSFGVKLGGSSHDRWSKNHSSVLSEKEKREFAAARLLGTPLCPRLDDVTIVEPLVCKKIAHERLTGLEFREDCIVTVCQEGFIVTWARPGKAALHRRNINSPVSVSSQKVPGATIV